MQARTKENPVTTYPGSDVGKIECNQAARYLWSSHYAVPGTNKHITHAHTTTTGAMLCVTVQAAGIKNLVKTLPGSVP